MALTFSAFAQDYTPFSIKFGVGTASNERIYVPGMSYLFPVGSSPFFRTEFSYKVKRNFEAGVYAAYGNLSRVDNVSYQLNENGQVVYVSATNSPKDVVFYGAKVNYLPLSDLLRSKRLLRFNPYIGLSVGGVSGSWNNAITGEKVIEKPFFEYGATIGTDFKFSQVFGMFAEYSIGHFYHDSNQRFQAGIKFDF